MSKSTIPTANDLLARAQTHTAVYSYNVDYIAQALRLLNSVEADIFGARSVVEVNHPDGYTIGWAFWNPDYEQWVLVFAENNEQL